MGILLYKLATQCYFLSIRLASFFNQKARLWTDGRVGVFEKLKLEVAQVRKQGQPLLWMHCASLGEFEQGRPVLEAWKKQRPDYFVLLTFFSPSGFELRKNDPLADAVSYLPADAAHSAYRFLELVQPELAVFVKYEFWYFYLCELRLRQIPTYLVSATFRPGQPFFQWYGGLHRAMLLCFTRIMVQDAPSANLLAGIGISAVDICGDTRIDRVLAIAARQRDFPEVEKFCAGAPVLVCGSTWAPDEKIVQALLHEPALAHWKLVLAPHDIAQERLAEVERIFPAMSVVRMAHLRSGKNGAGHRVLLIDNIGTLAGLYRYGQVAYVGGGFGAGIHNILEPMAHGLPVLFGPRFSKFLEAEQAIERGCGTAVSDQSTLRAAMLQYLDPAARQEAQSAAQKLLRASAGATDCVLATIQRFS